MSNDFTSYRHMAAEAACSVKFQVCDRAFQAQLRSYFEPSTAAVHCEENVLRSSAVHVFKATVQLQVAVKVGNDFSALNDFVPSSLFHKEFR